MVNTDQVGNTLKISAFRDCMVSRIPFRFFSQVAMDCKHFWTVSVSWLSTIEKSKRALDRGEPLSSSMYHEHNNLNLLFKRSYHSGTLVKDRPRSILVHFGEKFIDGVAYIASSGDKGV